MKRSSTACTATGQDPRTRRDAAFNTPCGLLEDISTAQRMFSIEFGLSAATPFELSSSFHASLIDVLGGYNYLVNTGQFGIGGYHVGVLGWENIVLALRRYVFKRKDNANAKLPAPPCTALNHPSLPIGRPQLVLRHPPFLLQSLPSDYLAEGGDGRRLYNEHALLCRLGLGRPILIEMRFAWLLQMFTTVEGGGLLKDRTFGIG